MKKFLRKWRIRVYERERSAFNCNMSTSVIAFTAEEAIEQISKNSQFNGESQGHPRNNWNPRYPLTFEAEEEKDE